MYTGDRPIKSWLPHPLQRVPKHFAPSNSSYRRLTTDSPSEEAFHSRSHSRNMVYGVLLGALVIGGAGSGWFFNQRVGRGEFPSLYEADIEAVTKGLERNHFTSVDLVKASCWY